MSVLCRSLLALTSKSPKLAPRRLLLSPNAQGRKLSTSSSRGAAHLDDVVSKTHLHNAAPPPKLPRQRDTAKRLLNKRKSPVEIFDQAPQHLKDLIIRLGLAIKADDYSEILDVWTNLREEEDLRPINTDILASILYHIYQKEGFSDKVVDAVRIFTSKKRWQPISTLLEQCMEAKRYTDVETLVTMFLKQLVEDQMILEGSFSPSRRLMSRILVYGSVAFSQKSEPDILPWISLVRKMSTYQISSTTNTETSFYSATSNGSPASFLSILKILQTVFDHPDDAKLAYTYARHAVLAWGLDYDHKTARMVFNFTSRKILLLFASNDIHTIQEFLSIAREANTKEYGQWLKITHSDAQEFDWNSRTWHQLIRGAICIKRPDIAQMAWNQYNEMKPNDEPPSPIVWLAFLQGYGYIRMWNQVRQTWKQIAASSVEPDERLYTSMILNLYRAHVPDEAASLFLELRSRLARTGKQLGLKGYAPILHGMLVNDRVMEAHALLKELQSEKDGMPAPRISIYNLFLRYYARRRDFEKINEILQEIANSEHAEADVFTFTTVMSAYTASGIEGAAEKVYKLMQNHGIKETNVTLTTMIQNLVEKGEDSIDDPVDFLNTLNILESMEKFGPPPTEVTYTSIISALIYHGDEFNRLYRDGYIAGSYAEALAHNDPGSSRLHLQKSKPNLRLCIILFQSMQSRRLRCNRVSCHTLLAGLLGDPMQEKDNNSRTTNLFCLRQAIHLFEFLQQDEGANAASWLLLLQRLMAWLQLTRDHDLREEVNERLSIAISEIKQTEFIKDLDVAETLQRAEKMLR